MSQPSVGAEIDAIEAKITAGLQEDRTGQGWQLQLDGAQWGIVLEALRRYKTQALMALESYPLRVEELSARAFPEEQAAWRDFQDKAIRENKIDGDKPEPRLCFLVPVIDPTDTVEIICRRVLHCS